MDDNTHYYKDPPKLIYELMQDTLGDRYEYFLGIPLNLDPSAYPCVVVQSTANNNTVTNAPTGTDVVSESINIHLLVLDSTNAAASGTQNTALRGLYQAVQGRDPATGFYMTGTVLYALRTNIDLGTAIIDHDIDVNYAVTEQADRNIIEAIVTVVTREYVSVPNRV